MEYKITNKKTGSSEVMNHEQICYRIMTCKGKFFDKYSKEHFSDTPIQDELNVKEISYSSNVLEKAVFKLSINHSVLAKRLSHKMKDIINENVNSIKENINHFIYLYRTIYFDI